MQVANLNILVPVLWFAHNRLNVRSTFILIRRSLKDKKISEAAGELHVILKNGMSVQLPMTL
ncbi:hypothetical protein CRN84_24455 [Budvicia aquatica]|uniref:Uncharacterized protein n=1 Tax=Budvicia aquatica TaxID=82979 RepID=A0A2C6DUU4_9GAMM|nr:hypothetical protein CRN84_24455 [Budvicia aquatica]